MELLQLLKDWIPLIGSGIALWLAIKKSGPENKKIEADSGKVSADTALLYARMAAEVGEQKRITDRRLNIVSENLDTVSEFVAELLGGIEILISQMETAGIKPEWTPPEKPKLRDTGELKLAEGKE